MPLVDLITPCRNRAEYLLKSLPTWLACDKLNRIIIVDFNSADPVYDQLIKSDQGNLDWSRICVVRAEDEPFWRQGRAQNIGIQFSDAELILKIDADVAVGTIDSYVASCGDDPQLFFKGFSKLGTSSGLCLCPRRAAARVSGYHDHMSGWGGDDVDFYRRLVKQGFHYAHFQADDFHEVTQPMAGKNSEARRLDTHWLAPHDHLAKQAFFTGCRNGLLSRIQRQQRQSRLRWSYVPAPGSADQGSKHHSSNRGSNQGSNRTGHWLAVAKRRNARLQPIFNYNIELANILTIYHWNKGGYSDHFSILKEGEVQELISSYRLILPHQKDDVKALLKALPQKRVHLLELAERLGVTTAVQP